MILSTTVNRVVLLTAYPFCAYLCIYVFYIHYGSFIICNVYLKRLCVFKICKNELETL